MLEGSEVLNKYHRKPHKILDPPSLVIRDTSTTPERNPLQATNSERRKMSAELSNDAKLRNQKQFQSSSKQTTGRHEHSKQSESRKVSRVIAESVEKVHVGVNNQGM